MMCQWGSHLGPHDAGTEGRLGLAQHMCSLVMLLGDAREGDLRRRGVPRGAGGVPLHPRPSGIGDSRRQGAPRHRS